jgi:alginate O-acetyltransferase complex protein AlgI
MAIGLGLMVGISLPPNFDSPFKARNIIDFWSRWHMTLTRFVTAYIYNPIVVRMTRSRARRGLSLPKRGRATPSAFVSLVAFPTIFSMFVIGVWHGAGWQFAVFGLLHGIFLTVNHAWRQVKVRVGLPLESKNPLAIAASVLLTFVCVVVALVFFRADSVSAAMTLLAGMAGANGIVLPERLMDLPGLASLRDVLGLPSAQLELFGLVELNWILALLAAVWILPNAQQWLRNYKTALVAEQRANWLQAAYPILVWRPVSVIGFLVGGVGFFVVLRAISAAPTEFLYFQF